MSVSLSNITTTWFTTNAYTGIGYSVTAGVANANSRLIKLTHNNKTAFDVDTNGAMFVYSTNAANTVNTNIFYGNNIVINTTGTFDNVTANLVSSNTVTSTNVRANVVKFNLYTVNTLPNAANAGAATRAFVSDSSVVTFRSNVFYGGLNTVPVFSNGTHWLIG